MEQHPLLKTRPGSWILPSQSVSLKVKNSKEWQEENMDVAENIARNQYFRKQKKRDNYRIANGELVYDRDDETNFDILEELSKDMSLPVKRQNYDIIGQPLATMEGEMDSFPDVFTVKGYGDIFEDEKTRVKTQLLEQWFEQRINENVQNRLLELQQEDPDWELYNDEQLQAKQQEIVQEMTPPEIEQYMGTKYKHVLEIWGQKELEDQFHRFKIKFLRKKDFFHYLRIAERYRHFYVGPKGLMVESVNPLYVFGLQDDNTDWTQDGEIGGIFMPMSIPKVIDRFGHRMTEKQLKSLDKEWQAETKGEKPKFISGKPINYLNPKGIPYATRVPTDDKDFNQYLRNQAFDPNYFDMFDMEDYHILSNMIMVTQAYWKSQRRLGQLRWINPQIGEEEILIVDENFKVPSWIKQIKDEIFGGPQEINTIVWTRETQIWQGIKLSNLNTGGFLTEPIYLDVQPCELQIGRLPIAGQYANNINTEPTSMIDKVRPYIWFHNVLWNQAYDFVQTEILPFALFSANMIPKDKDYGGDEGMMKWMSIAQALGMNIAETGPNAAGQQDGGQYPKIVDLDRGNRILVRIQMAENIKRLAQETIGLSPERMGAVKASQTATGTQNAINNSYTQTSGWFTSFFDGEREMLQMQLEFTKQLVAQGKQENLTNKSEYSVEALRLAMVTEYLYDLHVYVVDSKKERDNLELARRLALENNTSDMPMSNRLQLSTGSSLAEIMQGLKQAEKEASERMNSELQLRQQELQQQGMQFEQAQQEAAKQFQDKLVNNIEVALINAGGDQRDVDINQNGIGDALDYYQMINGARKDSMNAQIDIDKLDFERQKHNDAKEQQNADRRLARQKMVADSLLMDKKIKQADKLGDKSK